MPEDPMSLAADAVAGTSLADLVAATALAEPGVLRLEPSVAGGIRRLARRSGTGTDGVLVVQVADRLEVTVDIAVDGLRTAVETSAAVQQAVEALLRDQHSGPVLVMVRVLSVRPG